MNDDNIAPWAMLTAKVLAMLAGIVVAIYDLLIVYYFFVGGTLPILGWHIDANWFFALLFLVLGTTVTATLAYWATMLVCAPIIFLGYLTRKRRKPEDHGNLATSTDF